MRMSLGTSMRLAAAVATSAVLGVGLFAGAASASSQPGRAGLKNESCVIRLAPNGTSHSADHIIGRTCAATPGALRPDSGIEPGYIIFTIYQYTNYQGQHLAFTAPDPCSASHSWPVPDSRPADYGMSWSASSWKASNSCWNTTLYYDENDSGSSYTYAQGVWEAGQIGSGFDNHVWSTLERYQG